METMEGTWASGRRREWYRERNKNKGGRSREGRVSTQRGERNGNGEMEETGMQGRWGRE